MGFQFNMTMQKDPELTSLEGRNESSATHGTISCRNDHLTTLGG